MKVDDPEMYDPEMYDLAYLSEQCEALLFRMAFIRLAQEEADQVMKELKEGTLGVSEEEVEEGAARLEPRIMETIDCELRKRRRRHFARHTLPKIGRIAAGVLLVFFVGGTVAVAAVQPVRMQLMKFLINIERQYTHLSLVPDESAFVDVPEGWAGEYFPAYIPEGFAVTQVTGIEGCGTAQYQAEDERLFDFGEYDEFSSSNIDTEDAEIEYVEIGGAQAMLSQKKGHVILTWAWADRYFIVSLDGSVDVAVRIARSVQKIN
ncbi:MAG: DUF4367 domain-containing protein [Raoultibacter sp.]